MREESKGCLPLWGPYSKKYMGISRVMAESRITGARFDLVVHPTYANSAVPAPNVCVPSACHPWEADADGTCYTYRSELIWKDRLFADVSFFEVEPEVWGVRVEYTNDTDRMQNCLLNLFAAIEYPQKKTCVIKRPQKSEVWDALSYQEFTFAKTRPWEHLNPDGYRKGEVKIPEFTDGRGLGETWYSLMLSHLKQGMYGAEKGDFVSYQTRLAEDYEDAVLTVRYRTVRGRSDVAFSSAYGRLVFEKTTKPRMAALSLGKLSKGEFRFEMTACGAIEDGVILDFFCITERGDAGEIAVLQYPLAMIPERKVTEEGNEICYCYQNGEAPVYLSVFWDRVRERELNSGCLEDALPTRLSNSDRTYDDLSMSFSGSFSRRHSDDGFYDNRVLEAIFVPPGSVKTVYACVGTKPPSYSRDDLEQSWERRNHCFEKEIRENGMEYAFSVRLLKAALFSNVVYPIERHGEPVIHYTPGKRWDSLYTWDCGFIGLGMLEYSRKRAEYIMDLYLSEEENKDFAFLYHGSMVPTQFFLWHELFMRAAGDEKKVLCDDYPMFRRYYLFFAGKAEMSTTARYPSGLLTVYDYFYNAGGMDDYPAQAALHRQKKENVIAPVCTSVFLVRIAKIMKAAAVYCGRDEDVAEYEEDIRRVSGALMQYAWDEESGYFGYVIHDEDGNAQEIFRNETGENYNKGVEGIVPLIAGIGTPAQTERMLGHLRSEKELWSNVGVSTVDMSASYYYDNGYWNGSVWFPYQYLLWKSMLDLGEAETAFVIAQRALSAWKKETEFSYHTFEMIQIKSERGGWYHQFGGLSAPVCSFFAAYYRKGTVTAGFDTWISEREIEPGEDGARIVYRRSRDETGVLLAALHAGENYEVLLNGEEVSYEEHVGGTLEIPLVQARGEIVIRKRAH